jgi:L-lactate dehydrogenase complex protein LldG
MFTQQLAPVALAGAPPPTPTEVPRGYARSCQPADLLGHFVERVEDYRAVVERVPTGAPTDWTAADTGLAPVRDAPPLGTAELDRVDAVLTGAAVGIAGTGTIVLDGGPGQRRRALLVEEP